MEEDRSLISIIVPVYQVENYIDECIQSILKQTYSNLQIILIDDGTLDHSGEICDLYAKKDQRIEVIHKNNTGLSDTRNLGIRKAKGEYIGFVDSDDFISETMYEDMYYLIQKTQAQACICNLYIVTNNQKVMKNEDEGIQVYDKMQILKEIILDKKIQSYACNKLYKKELFQNLAYPVGKKYEDIGTTFYLLEKCNKIVVTGKPEYYYIQRSDSIVNQISEQTILDYLEVIEKRYEYIKEKYPELEPYNVYYLAKTLLTAYIDKERLETITEKLKQKVEEIYTKVKQAIQIQKEEVEVFFTQEQKKILHRLRYHLIRRKKWNKKKRLL